MIAPDVVREIRDLLEQGQLSQRKISQKLGVSRGTVNAIAQGKRVDRQPAGGRYGIDRIASTGPPRRCPGCGGLVWMPCLLCHIRGGKDRFRADPLIKGALRPRARAEGVPAQ
ncbi:MAG: helix-turn-helix domain-containing protein [Planctomycetes bacterium]|nr:helix-turn-helix domain-containing protein [Planctomycetota bacterium]